MVGSWTAEFIIPLLGEPDEIDVAKGSACGVFLRKSGFKVLRSKGLGISEEIRRLGRVLSSFPGIYSLVSTFHSQWLGTSTLPEWLPIMAVAQARLEGFH